MPIEFLTESTELVYMITSPQLPDWRCTAATRAGAERLRAASLKLYLRVFGPELSDEIRADLSAILGLVDAE